MGGALDDGVKYDVILKCPLYKAVKEKLVFLLRKK